MKMSFAQVAKGYLSTIANKNSFSLITNMRVASVSTGGVNDNANEGIMHTMFSRIARF